MVSSDKKNMILNTCIILTIIALVIYVVLANGNIIEGFVGFAQDDDEVCVINPIVEDIKKKIKKFIDDRKKPWKGKLEMLNKPGNFLDKITMCKGDSSYTLDKAKVYICTEDKNGKFTYDEHMLMHVTLHELAHVLCPEVGHTPLWEQIFEELMNEAHEPTCEKQKAIYNKFLPLIDDYCGVTADDTYDTSNP